MSDNLATVDGAQAPPTATVKSNGWIIIETRTVVVVDDLVPIDAAAARGIVADQQTNMIVSDRTDRTATPVVLGDA